MNNGSALDEDDGFYWLAEKITRDTEFRCASYKDKCLRRRIAVRMRARGALTYTEYGTILDTDSWEYSRLLDTLTINVTKFFRNWATFDSLAQYVLPALWQKSGPIRIWSAGSSSGEEPYSIATLLYRHAVALGEESQLSRVVIIGSDIDRTSLLAAQRALYPPTAFVETPTEFADRYFPRVGGHRTVLPEVQALVQFEQRDILREPAPEGLFDLIVCRNVVIYFERGAQEEVFLKFYHALAPGGYLLLGRAETLLGRPRSWFRPVDLRERIFQRPERM
ncbi:MAG TPA: protein-glutamate O-methyltransferase CheR [Gemmatimonadaceae bacterium]|jgi:chemotaxis protein methyltransferase CheR|nr:protein-glutamate O-methyltransferase CheR [Gemmatimonadaceae bacterium]